MKQQNENQSHFIEIFGSNMHYMEEGSGDPILFLHGMPTSSHVWRNVIPHLAGLGRCIAPDLIGMGKSDKPDIEYTLADHIKYINQFIKTLNLKRLTIVMHGWGSLIGFNYAMNNESNCKGLVFYEAYLRALENDEISLPYVEQIETLQSQENIYELMLNTPYFVDQTVPQSMMNILSDKEMRAYREPFLLPGSGKVLTQYFLELTDKNEKEKINKIIVEYSQKLIKSKLPKLMLYSIPGFVVTMATAIWAKENLKNIQFIEMGEELHFSQESHPALMGEAISVWLQGVEQTPLSK